MTAAAIAWKTISKRAIPNKIQTTGSRSTAAPLRDRIATRKLTNNPTRIGKNPARNKVPIEIDVAIEAGFTVPSIMVLLQLQHLMSSDFLQFGTDAFRMKTA
jgi:hypothetical protein